MSNSNNDPFEIFGTSKLEIRDKEVDDPSETAKNAILLSREIKRKSFTNRINFVEYCIGILNLMTMEKFNVTNEINAS